ncbi:cytidyltransferase domain protein [Ancylostoma ceylanicum]|uniref:choline-phosphate cytidylyltransferase n=1 Tax=Ancylostoma ceylanicum TaxID=53326 RepID=A0A0D6LU57_9BILA|nr:cytidyltransferase domain protein [Ancylostoma ceylanicum]
MASGDQRFVPYTLTQLRNGDFPQNRPIHIFAEGVYDLFHYGHARQLRQVKEAFPNVIVTAGLCSDELVIKNKGGPLVMTYEERVASVKECRYVDNVIDHGMFYPTIELLDRIQVPTKHISTTDLIQRIIDDSENFRERNTKREQSV